MGEIQILQVRRYDGATDMSYGNWIEDVADSIESDAATSQIEETFLYKVVGTGDKWDGEVVKMVKMGTIYHQISHPDSNAWTNIKPKFLQSLSSAEVAAALDVTKLTQKVLAEFGFSVGDAVNWKAADSVSASGSEVRARLVSPWETIATKSVFSHPV